MFRKERILILMAVIASFGMFLGCSNKSILKGTNVVIGVFWSDYDVETFRPQNSNQEKTLEWRTRIQRDHDFRIKEQEIATWNEMQGLVTSLIMTEGLPAGVPRNTLMVYALQGDWAMNLYKQNLLYPVSQNSVVDFQNPSPIIQGQMPVPWNSLTRDAFTFNGNVYAFSQDVNLYNFQAVFFNKRLFREAGLDPDLPYTMQADGTWNWENFINICKQLTRDINNDGIIDTYALPRDLSTEILDAIVASNDANYVIRNTSTGKFELGIERAEFMEALQYAIRLNNERVLKPRPENTNWDWYRHEFVDGNVAMRIDESNIWGELQNMSDDWGMVMFPKGPRADNYRVFTRENVFVIPATYKQSDVDKIMYALSLWFTPSDNNWKLNWYSNFRDSRAVHETLEYVQDMSLHVSKNHHFVPGLERGNIAWEMWHHQGDPAQLIETVILVWQERIDELNRTLGY